MIFKKGNLKTFLFIASVVLCSGVTSGIVVSYSAGSVHRAVVNTSLFLADVDTKQQSNDAELATHAQQLVSIAQEEQEAKDDRKLIHDEIYKLAMTETANYNQINDRLNVSDARTGAVGWLLGVLFTVTQSVLLYFHIGDKNKRGRRSTDAPGAS